ncbi:hypothetical protein ACYF6T_06585 [Streptomyces sp. 7R007]
MHHELWAVAAVLAGAAAGAVAGAGTGEASAIRAGTVAGAAVFLLAFLALTVLVRASRIRGVGVAREFEAARHLGDGHPPPRRSRPGPRLVPLLLFTGLLAYFLDDTGAVMVPLVLALDWLGKAALAARWERRRGRRLWRDPRGGHPSRLWYSALSPGPPTRTAIGAPPA